MSGNIKHFPTRGEALDYARGRPPKVVDGISLCIDEAGVPICQPECQQCVSGKGLDGFPVRWCKLNPAVSHLNHPVPGHSVCRPMVARMAAELDAVALRAPQGKDG